MRTRHGAQVDVDLVDAAILDESVPFFHADAATAERNIAQVFQFPVVYDTMTVRENLVATAANRLKRDDPWDLASVYDLFPRLGERAGQMAGTLSGGEQQMLAIGRGMMAEPRLMILDEPSLGLSPLLVEEMFGLIQNLNKTGLSFFLVEQNVMQSLEIANRAYVIENGKIVLSGNTDALLNDPELKKSYLGV